MDGWMRKGNKKEVRKRGRKQETERRKGINCS